MSDFKLYKKALISKLAPHLNPNIKNIHGEIKKNHVFFARWTSNFDCIEEKPWYYVIKDDFFDISSLRAKERNIIKKGITNYEIKFINFNSYVDELYEIFCEMNKILPKNSRSYITKNDFLLMNSEGIFIGAFSKQNNKLSAYAVVDYYDDEKNTLNFKVLRYLPLERNKNVNAAIINFLCIYFINKKNVKYICDGERSIRHDTTFQDYLIRYFGFRKAYCDLNIEYAKKIKVIVNLLYPFRKALKAVSKHNSLFHNVYTLLYQEQLFRKCREQKEN